MKKSKKKDTVWTRSWDPTCTWNTSDMYTVVVPCVNRFKTAFNVLFKGKTKLAWQVPITKKDKRLIIKGKKCHSGKP